MTAARPTHGASEAVTTTALAVAVVAGCLFLWIGVPLLGFWLAGQVATTAADFLLVALATIPPAMVVVGWLLSRVNGAYERLRHPQPGGPTRAAWLVGSSDERAGLRRARSQRSLIEAAMTFSVLAAIAIMVGWFFIVAESQCCAW